MEWAVLGSFCLMLLICVALGVPILYALLAGLLLFVLYALRRGFSPRQVLSMAAEGVGTVFPILTAFLFIGMMTALWRAAGTIPVTVIYASGAVRPSVFLLMAFLLNCVISFLTGTSFGTAATMGVICTAMGAALGADPVLTGGAVLSGAFFGDRCSPVSTSALLVCAVTGTDIYSNIRRMVKSAGVPFALTLCIYLALGPVFPGEGTLPDTEGVFSRVFVLSPVCLIPAAVILISAVLRIKVKAAMALSILSAVPVCLFVQGMSAGEVALTALRGFRPDDARAAAMIGGGGILSMVNVAGIVCISSAYSGIFKRTGLLDGTKRWIASVSRRTTPFAAMLLTAVFSCMIACSQTLAILLCGQICGGGYEDRDRLALDLEDTAVVISPLVPWSIAGSVPLTAIGAPMASMAASFFLILLPLCRLASSLWKKHRAGKEGPEED